MSNAEVFEKMDLSTPDLVNENAQKIAQLFPNCVVESRGSDGAVKHSIDFDALKQELSHDVASDDAQRYQMTWPGKAESVIEGNAPIDKTLRPSRDESVDFDTTKNLFIEGDNLDALKLLQETYLGKVKMIYIDPPYNTGKDFVYKDNFKAKKADFDEDSDYTDEEGGRLVSNPNSNGRYHSDWLSMIYPRLRLARNLLSDDGVIFISIDENEVTNLNKLCTEVFGEDNFLENVIWDKGNPKGDAKGFSTQSENICVYAKNIEIFKNEQSFMRPKKNAQKILAKASFIFKKNGSNDIPKDLKDIAKRYELDLDLNIYKKVVTLEDINKDFQKWIKLQDISNGEKAYQYIDNIGQVYREVSMAWPNKKQAPKVYFIPLIHPVTKEECPVPERGWRNPPETMQKLLEENKIIFGVDHTTQPRRKYLLSENMNETIPNILYFGGSDDKVLKGFSLSFENPKPHEFIKQIISYVLKDSNDIILDFFAGSGTTAHAVMALNAEDGGNRKCISVQLPEVTDSKGEAYKAGYKTIAEISKERIRRAGKKILADNAESKEPKDLSNLDTGFRVLKVATGNRLNIKDVPSAERQEGLFDKIGNIKSDRSGEDLLFGVILDWGIDLSLPIETLSIGGKTVYAVYDRTDLEDTYPLLMACFSDDITDAFTQEIATHHKPLRMVFKDESFRGNDSAKINTAEIFKTISPTTQVKVI